MSELVGSVCIGLADIVTDGISYALLTHGNTSTNQGLNTAYVAVLSFGVVTTILSLGYRFHNARRMQAHILELSEKQRRTGSSTATRRQAEQHEWELAQTHRTKIILSLGLLSVAAQGLLARREPRIRPEPGGEHSRCDAGAAAVCRSADVDPQLLYRLFHRSCGQDGEHIPRCQEAQELVFPQTRSTKCHTE